MTDQERLEAIRDYVKKTFADPTRWTYAPGIAGTLLTLAGDTSLTNLPDVERGPRH